MSVVIRAHQHGRFLEEAVESVLRQSRPVDEIVVVDDASTDDTSIVLSELERRSSTLRSVTHVENQGPARAFNVGAGLSTGQLLLPLDADDRLSPRFVEHCATALEASGADIAYPGLQLFGAEREWRPAGPVDLDELFVENTLHVSCMFRRWILDATGGFDPGFDQLGLEDWDFWIGAVEAGARVVPVEGCWLEYRRFETGARSDFSRADALRAHVRVYRRHPAVELRHLRRWAVRSALRNVRRAW